MQAYENIKNFIEDYGYDFEEVGSITTNLNDLVDFCESTGVSVDFVINYRRDSIPESEDFIFKTLVKEIEAGGYSLFDLAELIGKDIRIVKHKLSGHIPFTLGEVKFIQLAMFPDKTVEYLFEV